jgi:hypothetical protein
MGAFKWLSSHKTPINTAFLSYQAEIAEKWREKFREKTKPILERPK